jgi:hypothetical protein
VNWRKGFAYGALALVAADLVLLMSGGRILVNEWRGAEFPSASSGGGFISDDKDAPQALYCEYFTGRSFRTTTFNGVVGKALGDNLDECPFFYRP